MHPSSARPSGAPLPDRPTSGVCVFGAFRLDLGAKQLLLNGEPVLFSPKQFEVLRALALAAGRIVSKDDLIKAGWQEQAVSDSNLEKLVAQLRQRLAEGDATAVVETVPRRGYRLTAPVAFEDARLTDAELDAMMAPHNALFDGRALIETLDRARLDDAIAVFADLVARDPGNARCHVGLANACAWRFEATRAEAAPDVQALARAVAHASEARRLDPRSGEAWAVFGFVVDRTGDKPRALGALRQAVALEPDSWRHPLRLAYAAWGDERIHAARRTLELCPRLPTAYLLVAMVFVARNSLALAERELDSGLAAMPATSSFSAVGLHWLKGLLCLARGDAGEAHDWFRRELALESRGHLYAKECCANTWYAIGFCHMQAAERDEARRAFGEAILRVPRHPMAHAALAILDDRATLFETWNESSFEGVLARAAVLMHLGDATAAARVVDDALESAPPGNAGWTLPLEPLVAPRRAPDAWAVVLDRLRNRAT